MRVIAEDIRAMIGGVCCLKVAQDYIVRRSNSKPSRLRVGVVVRAKPRAAVVGVAAYRPQKDAAPARRHVGCARPCAHLRRHRLFRLFSLPRERASWFSSSR